MGLSLSNTTQKMFEVTIEYGLENVKCKGVDYIPMLNTFAIAVFLLDMNFLARFYCDSYTIQCRENLHDFGLEIISSIKNYRNKLWC